MGEHTFKIDFVVNNTQTKEARLEESQGYKLVEAIATEALKRIGKTRDDEANKAKANVRALLTDEQVAARAREALIDQTNRKAIKAHMDQMDAAKKAAQAQVQAQKEVADQTAKWNSATQAVIGSLTTVVGAAGGITSLGSAVGLVVEAFRRARDQAYDAGQMAREYRDTLRELAALKGQTAPTTAVMRQEIDLRRITLQNAGAAKDLQTTFLGGAQAAIDTGKISKGDAQRFMEFVGSMQSAEGSSPQAYGNLASTIPLAAKGTMSGEDASRMFAQLFRIAQPSKATFGQLAEQMSATAGMTMSGQFRDIRRQFALGSFLGIGTPGEAGTGLEQLGRMTVGSLKDMTKAPGASMTPAEYLSKLGATDQMDVVDISNLMLGDAEKEQARLQKQGKQLNIQSYLRDRGYSNIQDINRFTQLFGGRDMYRSKFAPMMDQLPSMADAQRPINEYRVSPDAQAKRAALEGDIAKLSQGVGPLEFAQSLERRAFAKAQSEGKLSGNFEDWKGSIEMSGFMQEMLRAEAGRVGIDATVRQGPGSFMGPGARIDPLSKYFRGLPGTREQAQGFEELGSEIARRGGDPMGSNTKLIELFEKNTAAAVKTEEAMRQLVARMPAPQPQAFNPGGKNAGRQP